MGRGEEKEKGWPCATGPPGQRGERTEVGRERRGAGLSAGNRERESFYFFHFSFIPKAI